RRGLVVKVLLACFVCALILALSLPTIFASSATVLLDPRKNNVTDLSAVISPIATDPAAVQNQIQIITSREVAAAVVDRLALARDPEFTAAIAPPGLGDMLNPGYWLNGNSTAPAALQRERVIDNLRRHVSADAEGLSTAITISARSRDAVKAASI